MHRGDRTHPRLVELDSQSWSYPGWQVDFAKAEQAHVKWESDYCCDMRRILLMMKKKQQVHLDGRSHPDLVRLDRLKLSLSYPGWEADFRAADEKHITAPDIFNDCMFKLIEKQRIYHGDRTHPRLVALDSQSWSYPGWQVDFTKAEQAHVEWENNYRCDAHRILLMMKKKQKLYLSGHYHTTQIDLSGQYHTTQIAFTVEPLQPQESQVQPMDTSANSVLSEPSQPESRLDSKALTGACVICMTASKSHVFVPCGHLCVCEACATESFKRSRLCPMCRNKSHVVTQIFFS